MTGYVYRGTNRDVTNERRELERKARERFENATAVLNILTNLAAISDRRAVLHEASFRRSCCGTCGALFLGATCDVCRARLGAAA